MAVDQDAFARSMRAMRKLDAVAEGLVLALQHLTDATRELFGVDGAGLMLLDEEGVLRWVSVTDETGLALEQAQQELGMGPCVAALEAGRVVATSDVVADQRWPRLAQVLAESRVRAVLSIPVLLRGHVVGTLNVLSNTAREWDDGDCDAVEAYAGIVGHLLDTALEAQRADQLEQALTARILIEQAKGVLIARENLDPREAWERLRSMARSTRRRVTEVAQEVVASAVDQDGQRTVDVGEAARPARLASELGGEATETVG